VRLAVITDQPFWFDGTRYTTNATFINFVLSFKACVDKMMLIAPLSITKECRGNFVVGLEDERVELVPMPFFKNSTEMYYRFHALAGPIWRLFKSNLKNWDLAWIVGMHLPQLMFYRMANNGSRKLFFYIRSNIAKETESQGYRGIKGVCARMLSGFLASQLLRASQSTPFFVVGDELFEMYSGPSKRVYKVYPTLVYEKDIVTGVRPRGPGPTVLLCVGRLTPEKNLEVLVEAMDLLRRQGDGDFVCWLAGSGKEAAPLRALISQKGLDAYFDFKGYVPHGPDLFALYDAAHIYVSPSRTEGLPKTFYEAMARGLPIISTRVGGIPEIVADGENGLLVPPGDPQSLAAAIKRLTSDSGLRESLSWGSINKVRDFTLEKQRDRMFHILKDEILGRGRV